MEEIVPGLYHWTTEHPNLGQPVGSHYLTAAATVIDPMVPPEGIAAVRALGPVEHVVLSCRHHDRDHAEFVREFGATFHVSEAGAGEYAGEDLSPYRIGEAIVPGVVARANGPIAPDDTVLELDVEGGALLFADSLLSDGGHLRLMPDRLLGEDADEVRGRIIDALEALLDTEFAHLLFAHGDPVIDSGHQRLADFVQNAR